MTKDNIWEIKTSKYINILEANKNRYDNISNFIKINKFPLIFIGTVTTLIITNS